MIKATELTHGDGMREPLHVVGPFVLSSSRALPRKHRDLFM
jgi:hypothetical protein